MVWPTLGSRTAKEQEQNSSRRMRTCVCGLTFLVHPVYAATLPCNLSLMACFLALMFYKRVWQRTQRVVGFLSRNLPVNKFSKSVKVCQNCARVLVASLLLGHRVAYVHRDSRRVRAVIAIAVATNLSRRVVVAEGPDPSSNVIIYMQLQL